MLWRVPRVSSVYVWGKVLGPTSVSAVWRFPTLASVRAMGKFPALTSVRALGRFPLKVRLMSTWRGRLVQGGAWSVLGMRMMMRVAVNIAAMVLLLSSLIVKLLVILDVLKLFTS